MAKKQYSYVGKGSIWLGPVGGKLRRVGNCSELTLNAEEEKQTQPDYENPGGGVVATLSRVNEMTLDMTVLNISPENIALAMRGLVDYYPGGVVNNESHVATLDGLVKLNHLQDLSSSTTILVKSTNNSSGTTYVKDTDYVVHRAGIEPLSTGAITESGALYVTYDSLPSNVVQALVDAGTEMQLVFDGMNEAVSGNPTVVEVFRVKPNITSGFNWIGEEFAEMPVTMDVLKDETKVGVGISQYFKAEIGDINA